jgi:hypothetical protein
MRKHGLPRSILDSCRAEAGLAGSISTGSMCTRVYIPSALITAKSQQCLGFNAGKLSVQLKLPTDEFLNVIPVNSRLRWRESREENINSVFGKKRHFSKAEKGLLFLLTNLRTNGKNFHEIPQEVYITVGFHTALFCIFSDEEN